MFKFGDFGQGRRNTGSDSARQQDSAPRVEPTVSNEGVEALKKEIERLNGACTRINDAFLRHAAMRVELQIALKRMDPSHALAQPFGAKKLEDAFGDRIKLIKEGIRRDGDDSCIVNAVDHLDVRESELDKAVNAARVDMLEAMLPVYETLLLSLEHGEDLAQHHRDGLEAAVRQFREAIVSAGAELVNPSAGEKFDPLVHEALFSVPGVEGDEKGTVKEVRRPGVRVGKRLLRPAVVVVVG